jgi:hypothetical protein
MGGLCALAYFLSFECGVAALVASLWAQIWAKHRGRHLVFCMAGFAALWVLGIGLLMPFSALGDFFRVSVGDVGRLLISRLETSAPRALLGISDNSMLLLAVVGGELVVMTRFLIRRHSEGVFPSTLALYGLILSAPAWIRTDRYHVYYVLSPALFLGIFAVHSAVARGRARHAGVLTLIFLAVGSVVTLPPYIFWQERLSRQADLLVSAKVGRFGGARLPFHQARGYDFLLNWLRDHLNPEETFLFFPYNGALYFLADRPNPLRFPTLTDAVARSQQEESVARLEDRRTAWVVWDEQNTHFDGIPVRDYLAVITGYLDREFIPIERVGPFTFLKRRNTSGE